MNPRVVAVTVTYNPGVSVLAQVSALASQIYRVLIVDNGSGGAGETLLRSWRGENVELMFLGQNFGIGIAHNAGIRRAREIGATHVLLLDQDSTPHQDMVKELLAAEAKLLARGKKVGALGPVFHDSRLAKSWPFYRMSRFGIQPHPCAGQDVIACDFLISSGTLARLSAIDEIGLINEGYFLEHVDTEWSLRARHRGYALFGVCAARMDHTLGDDTVNVPLSDRRVQLYQPYRHYYLFRNAALLWREEYAALPWKLNEIRRLLARLVFFPLFVAPRIQRLRFMLLGLWHGILGRTGPLRP